MKTALGPKDPVFCTRCGYTGRHRVEYEITGGQWATLFVLLLLGVLPGIIYGISLAMGGGNQGVRVCPECRAKRMWAPVDSPAARSATRIPASI
jgi:hypothetical protein